MTLIEPDSDKIRAYYAGPPMFNQGGWFRRLWRSLISAIACPYKFEWIEDQDWRKRK